MTVQFEKAVLPSTKIVKYSDVIYTIQPDTPCATPERIERFRPVCLAIVGNSHEVNGVRD